MTIDEAVSWGAAQLRGQIVENPKRESQLLLAAAAGLGGESMHLNCNRLIEPQTEKKFREFILRRKYGEPYAYIVGYKGFYKNNFLVSRDVLIPRPETEHLVEAVLLWKKENIVSEKLCLVDMGTGSGCIGLSLLSEWPQADLVAIDISSKAIEVAKQNASVLKLSDRCHFLHIDLNCWDTYSGSGGFVDNVDIVVANPPYVPSGAKSPIIEDNVVKYEPHEALFSEDGGTADFSHWLHVALKILKPKGLFACEIGKGQRKKVEEIVHRQCPGSNCQFIKDYSQVDRVVLVEKC